MIALLVVLNPENDKHSNIKAEDPVLYNLFSNLGQKLWNSYPFHTGLKQYKLYKEFVTWPEAALACRKKLGYLATIHSPEENSMVTKLVQVLNLPILPFISGVDSSIISI